MVAMYVARVSDRVNSDVVNVIIPDSKILIKDNFIRLKHLHATGQESISLSRVKQNCIFFMI